jgi:hypothetical protein
MFLANNVSSGPVCILVVRILVRRLCILPGEFLGGIRGVRERMDIAVATLVPLMCLSELIVFWDQNFYMETHL